MLTTRRRFLGGLGAATLGALAAACSASSAAPTPGPTSPPATRAPQPVATTGGASTSATPASQAAGGLTALVTNSELVVGRNRFTMALLDPQNQPVTDATVTLEFFQVQGNQATKQAEAPATFRWVDQPGKGVYVAQASFAQAGDWGLQATVKRPSGQTQQVRADFQVQAKPAAPIIGSAAPRSANPILADVGGDASKLCTNTPPCDMHNLRIKDALTQAKPLVVLFATPGFCTSRTCAPELGVVQQLRDKHREQANVVHIEIYKDPQNRVVADTVNEWGLQSEPWVFLVGKDGKIGDRFEGATTLDELEAGLKPLL
jgi:hypothetical protein